MDMGPANSDYKRFHISEVLSLPAGLEAFQAGKIDALLEDKLLPEVQAGILMDTGHLFTLYCFLTFNPAKKRAIGEWLKDLKLATARDQWSEGLQGLGNENAITLLLSYEGYEFLLDERRINGLIPLKGDDDINAFRKGLANRCPDAFGGVNRRTVENYYEKPSHALVLIHSNDILLKEINARRDTEKGEAETSKALLKFFSDATFFGEDFGEVFFEIGMRNPEGSSGQAREWFGFRDGISNPRFFPSPETRKTLGPRFEEPAPLSTVLRKDRLSPNTHACGSFAVFLKLQEHRRAFEELATGLAAELSIAGPDGEMRLNQEEAEAYIIGRYKDGSPLRPLAETLQKQGPLPGPENQSAFEGCPLQAHIRKAAPLGGQSDKRIVRRGRIYGHEKSSRKGILFLSFQSSFRQFEDIINRGLYAYNYHNLNIGQDLLFAEKGSYLVHEDRKYRDAAGNMQRVYQFVHEKPVSFRGGQYFFAPSVSFIRESLIPYMKK